ncbi:MAG: NFACT RNA binding domain-containing protein [Cyclobacteriaceae bacterium]
MHNNFYFLRHLSAELNKKIIGFTVVSCFSQNKEELIIELNNSKESFFIKASLQPSFCCLSFPSGFSRAKKNSIDLFNDILIKKVIGIRQFENERSFALELEDHFVLLFKMHGNQSNIVLFQKEKVISIFRNQFQNDYEINLSDLDKTIDWNKEVFLNSIGNLSQTPSPGSCPLEPASALVVREDTHHGRNNTRNLSQLYLTLGKEVNKYLEEKFQGQKSSEDKWIVFQETIKQLENPTFYIQEKDGKLSLSLLPTGKIEAEFTNPIEAINEFFYKHTTSQTFLTEKAKALRELKDQLKGRVSYLDKNQQKVDELQNDQHHQLWADLIMANMHLIKQGTEKIQLENFYTGKPEEIKLKKELNAQRNAEVFYRKAKNQQIEIDKLNESIHAKKKEIEKLKLSIAYVEQAEDLKLLRQHIKAEPAKPKNNNLKALPYHTFEFKGFQIWVGKNAEANDELTLKHAYKEDLWVHAKDVAGSHVIIKHQSGKNFPKDVIERAAQLAAYNSKRKTDSLCPIAVTPKKFVRKRKGDPAGMVVVEKEEVVMVVPKL